MWEPTTTDSGITESCADIILSIIGDLLHNSIKHAQSSDLHIHVMRLLYKRNFAVQPHRSSSVTTSADVEFSFSKYNQLLSPQPICLAPIILRMLQFFLLEIESLYL